ncbi:dynamin family protein [Neobacillus sp. SAB-20_R2A]|uniref:dynamin family protein n=1 Tax=Neobacillus sp. SAB-20_R2A TaxID=3120519 RepID=UPI003C6E0D82
MNSYTADFENRKKKLLQLLEMSAGHFLKYGAEEKVHALESLAESVRKGEFTIVVVGEFSAGKSTFLNAIMGEKYLPSFTSETTATINFLKHFGKSQHGHGLEVHYRDTTIPPAFADATESDIRKYVSTASETDVVKEIDHVNLFLDSPFLEKGVMLVDSPGLNGIADGHRQVTKNQVEKSHACIFVFRADQPGSKSDFEVLTELTDKFDTIILVLNKIDKIKLSEESVEDVVERLIGNYRKVFPDKPLPEIWPIASYPALVARSSKALEYPEGGKIDHSVEEKQHYLEISRLEEFENRLWRYLTQGEKAKEEMLAPVMKMIHSLSSRQQYIEDRIHDLESKKDSTEIKAQMSELETEIEKLNLEISNSQGEIYQQLTEIVNETIEHLKSEAQHIKTKYEKEVSEWTDMNDIQSEVEYMNRLITQEYSQAIEKVYSTFQDQFQELIQGRYRQYSNSVFTSAEQKDLFSAQAEIAATKELDMDIFNFSVGLDRFEAERKNLQKELNALEDELDKVEADMVKAERVRLSIETVKEDIQYTRDKERYFVEALGPRPEAVMNNKKERVKESRGGVLGFVADILVGKRKIDVDHLEYDYSIRREYDKEREAIRNKIMKEEDELVNQLKELEHNRSTEEEFMIRRRQIERRKQQVRDERKAYEEQFREEFQEKNRKALRKVKNEIGTYIRDLRRDTEKVFIAELKEKRNLLVDIIVEVIHEQLKQKELKKHEDLRLLAEQLDSSAQEKQRLIQEFNEELSELKQLLTEAVSLEHELKMIEADRIER